MINAAAGAASSASVTASASIALGGYRENSLRTPPKITERINVRPEQKIAVAQEAIQANMISQSDQGNKVYIATISVM